MGFLVGKGQDSHLCPTARHNVCLARVAPRFISPFLRYGSRYYSSIPLSVELKSGSEPNHYFTGQIGGQALRDKFFHNAFVYPAGPFPTLTAFHDCLACLSLPIHSTSFSRERRPELSGLSDEEPIVFTHSDLHGSNIMISPPETESPRVIAVLDWHQSGWYPRHWEVLKANWTADLYGEWAEKYIPQFLEPADFEYFRAFEWVRMCRGI